MTKFEAMNILADFIGYTGDGWYRLPEVPPDVQFASRVLEARGINPIDYGKNLLNNIRDTVLGTAPQEAPGPLPASSTGPQLQWPTAVGAQPRNYVPPPPLSRAERYVDYVPPDRVPSTVDSGPLNDYF